MLQVASRRPAVKGRVASPARRWQPSGYQGGDGYEGRAVSQHLVPGGRRCRRAHPGAGRTGSAGARLRLFLVVVSAPLPHRAIADAADPQRDGLPAAGSEGHAGRSQHPDPAAAQSGARGRGSGDPGCAERRTLRAGRRPGLPRRRVRGVRHQDVRARAAAGGSHRADAPAVDRGQGHASRPVLPGQRCGPQPEAGAPRGVPIWMAAQVDAAIRRAARLGTVA